MTKRNYKLQDIYDYLLEYYGLTWNLFLINDFDVEHMVQKSDFNGKNRSCLTVTAITYRGSKRVPVWLNVSNKDLVVGVLQPIKPLIKWSDYLALKHHEELTL